VAGQLVECFPVKPDSFLGDCSLSSLFAASMSDKSIKPTDTITDSPRRCNPDVWAAVFLFVLSLLLVFLQRRQQSIPLSIIPPSSLLRAAPRTLNGFITQLPPTLLNVTDARLLRHPGDFFPSSIVQYPAEFLSPDPSRFNATIAPLEERDLPFYVALDGVLIFPPSPVVVTRDFRVQVGFPRSLESLDFLPILPIRRSTYEVEHAIFVTHLYADVYGHVLNELLPGFMGIPAEIWNKSVLFLPHHALRSVFIELLQICGKVPVAVLPTSKRWIFAQHLYVPNPWIFVRVWPDCLRSMRTRIIAILGLQDVIPSHFAIAQRPHNRLIENVDQLFSAAVKEFPDRQWTLLRDRRWKMSDQVAFFANITMLIVVSGSTSANTMWMRCGAVLIQLHVRWYDPFFVDVARAVGLKVFETAAVTGNRKAFPVDIPFMIQLIARGCDFLRQNGPR
jgi:hypothetical protein